MGSFLTQLFSIGNITVWEGLWLIYQYLLELALGNLWHQNLIDTMSTKNLGTLPVIYAVDELQNPLLRTTMLFEGDRNSTGGRNGVFPNS